MTAKAFRATLVVPSAVVKDWLRDTLKAERLILAVPTAELIDGVRSTPNALTVMFALPGVTVTAPNEAEMPKALSVTAAALSGAF